MKKILIFSLLYAFMLTGCGGSGGSTLAVGSPDASSTAAQPSNTLGCTLEYQQGKTLPPNAFNINSIDNSYFVTFDPQFNIIIDNHAKQLNISQFLISGIIGQESDWQPDVVSNLGAKGLMQVIPDIVIP